MKRSVRRLAVLVMAIVLIAVPAVMWTLSASAHQQYAANHDTGSSPPAGPERVSDGALRDLKDFQTNLPILVLDAGGQKFDVHTVWDQTTQGFDSVNYDPYRKGFVSLIDTGTGVNRLSDPPQWETAMKARLRGASSQTFPKKQYKIELLDEYGNKDARDVLGMGSSPDWVLNISYLDKSLLRNYLAYTIAGQVMDCAPKARYCEVFFKDADTYLYEGLYMLIQNIEEGDSFVPLTKYNPNYAETAFIVRRDRLRDSAVTLYTYSTKNHLTPEYLSVRYPKDTQLTQASTDYITNTINQFETALYAKDDKDFLRYRDYIDVGSFIDYFILNEFFGNYDSTLHSVFTYQDIGGKLTMGPVWDFDRAMDNDFPLVLKTDSTAMHDGAWYQAMLRDGDFVKQILTRYAELRKGPLSDAHIDAIIDDAVRYIKPAQIRDWNRWDYNRVYDSQFTSTVPINILPLTSDRLDYAGSVDKLKTVLREHGGWMDAHLDTLYQYSTISPDQSKSGTNWIAGFLAIVVVIAFFVTVYLVQRE